MQQGMVTKRSHSIWPKRTCVPRPSANNMIKVWMTIFFAIKPFIQLKREPYTTNVTAMQEVCEKNLYLIYWLKDKWVSLLCLAILVVCGVASLGNASQFLGLASSIEGIGASSLEQPSPSQPDERLQRRSGSITLKFFRSRDQIYSSEILIIFEKLWQEYKRRGRPLPDGEITIIVHPSVKEFSAATGKADFVAATTRGAVVELQPPAVLRQKSTLESTLAHEFAHVSMNTVQNEDTPLWLKEGFAVYLAAQDDLLQPKRPRTFKDGEELDLAIELPESADDLMAAYRFAFEKVRTLIRKHGEKYVWEILRKGEASFDSRL